MNTCTHAHTHIAPLTQRSHAKHNTPHHNTPTLPLPLPLHTNTLTHANIINSLFPFSMTMTCGHSLNHLSAHRARICPVGHMAWALAPSLFGEKKVEKQICQGILAYILVPREVKWACTCASRIDVALTMTKKREISDENTEKLIEKGCF